MFKKIFIVKLVFICFIGASCNLAQASIASSNLAQLKAAREKKAANVKTVADAQNAPIRAAQTPMVNRDEPYCYKCLSQSGCKDVCPCEFPQSMADWLSRNPDSGTIQVFNKRLLEKDNKPIKDVLL